MLSVSSRSQRRPLVAAFYGRVRTRDLVQFPASPLNNYTSGFLPFWFFWIGRRTHFRIRPARKQFSGYALNRHKVFLRSRTACKAHAVARVEICDLLLLCGSAPLLFTPRVSLRTGPATCSTVNGLNFDTPAMKKTTSSTFCRTPGAFLRTLLLATATATAPQNTTTVPLSTMARPSLQLGS